ncbi:MAG: 50S ribosomal protein L25, partial [Acidimicrobiales bacterium]
MPEVTLAAEAGRPTGSSSTRRLRARGKIPGVVYGHGSDPIPVAVGAREFQIAMSGEAGLNTLLSLEVGKGSYLTLARDIQRHPFRNVVTHVDFQIVRRDEVISAEIPINLVGEAIEV